MRKQRHCGKGLGRWLSGQESLLHGDLGLTRPSPKPGTHRGRRENTHKFMFRILYTNPDLIVLMYQGRESLRWGRINQDKHHTKVQALGRVM